MGHEIERQALLRGHEITARIDVHNTADIHSDAFRSADVAIEFTNPRAALANCLEALGEHMPVVSGSTGWLDHLPQISRYCLDHPGAAFLHSTNFSIGMNIFMRLNKQLARLTAPFPQYTPALTETHHIHKLDHPSGTAITLADDLVSSRSDLTDWTLTSLTAPDGSISHPGQPAPHTLPIASIRQGEVPGIHSITWNSEADSITITHSAHSRAGFALGAVMAAEWLPENPGFRSMQQFMDHLFSSH